MQILHNKGILKRLISCLIIKFSLHQQGKRWAVYYYISARLLVGAGEVGIRDQLFRG